jgi:hypothetical protein
VTEFGAGLRRASDSATSGARSGTRLIASNVIASLLVAGGMITGWTLFRGSANPDWAGYERIFNEQGAWLADRDRDPIFLAFVGAARDVLGPDGYEAFRLGVFALMLVATLLLVFRLPPQRELAHKLARAAVVSVAVVAIMITKALVQIREGLAFSLVAIAVVRLVPAEGREELPQGVFMTYGLLALAALTHAGTGVYVVTFAAADLVSFALSDATVRRRGISVVAATLAVVGAFVLRDQIASRLMPEDEFALDLVRSDVSQVLKYVYWALMGGVLFVLARQVRGAARTLRQRKAAAFAAIQGWVVLPLVYTLALLMLVSQQPLHVTSMLQRMLSTAVGVALVTVLMRGRANYWTLGIAGFFLVSQIRTIMIAVS